MTSLSEKVRPLFENWSQTMVWSCLDGVMGELFVENEDCPRSALIIAGKESCFGFLAGQPNESLLQLCEGRDIILVPQSPDWSKLIEKIYGDRVFSFERYATKKDTLFDCNYLKQMVHGLPADFSLCPIGRSQYEELLSEDWSRDLVGNYDSFEQFEQYGLGYVVYYQGKIVSGASSYSSYRGGIEVEVDTHSLFRRRGLAKAVAAQLILTCLKKCWYPSWDAHNLASLALAERLGYELDAAYQVYERR